MGKIFFAINILLIFSVLTAGNAAGQAYSGHEEARYVPTEANLASRQEFREAGLGIFIHWGVYSMLGDGEWDMPEGYDWRYDELYPLIHSLQPGCLIGNNHHRNPIEGEDIQIFERDLPGENLAGYSGAQDVSAGLPLETCQTMGASWGYDIHDDEYKSAEELIHYLVNAAGRGGNLLLNIGPGPDGKLPEQAVDRLESIGKWMDEFGFTIYGTQRGDIPPRDWGATTRKGNRLYIHILDLQDDSLFLPLKDCKITAAQCINDGKRLKFIQDKDGVLLKLGTVPDETDFIVELVLKQTTIK